MSGSATQFLAPLAAELGVSHVLANRLEMHRGRFTGQLIPPQTIGVGKRQAALSLMSELSAEPNNCFAYGDHLSDLPLLMSVGTPTVVARDPALIQHARQHGWPILWPAIATQGGKP
ncbi:phosphoserine phosphatase [compost metagenome]